MFGTYINTRSHSGLYSLLFYKVDVAFVVYHDQPFVEQHIESMYGLRGPCSPASIAYAGKELMALRIKNLGTASFVGDINLVVGTGDTVRAAAEFPGSFSVLPFLELPKCFLPPPARPNTSTLYWLSASFTAYRVSPYTYTSLGRKVVPVAPGKSV